MEVWKVHDHAHLLFFTHTLYMNYIIAMFLLVSCMNTLNHLVFCQVLCTANPQNSEQKPTTKNFAGFHNHLPLLTMFGVGGVGGYGKGWGEQKLELFVYLIDTP